MKHSAKVLVSCALLLGLLYLGVALLYSAWVDNRSVNEKRWWPSVEGIVFSSSLKLPPRGSFGLYSGSATIQYSYVVNGKNFEGLDVISHSGFIIRETAKEIVSAYPVGRKITVFYDQQNPHNSRSELVSLVDPYVYVRGIFGVLSLVLMAIFFSRWLRVGSLQ